MLPSTQKWSAQLSQKLCTIDSMQVSSKACLNSTTLQKSGQPYWTGWQFRSPWMTQSNTISDFNIFNISFQWDTLSKVRVYGGEQPCRLLYKQTFVQEAEGSQSTDVGGSTRLKGTVSSYTKGMYSQLYTVVVIVLENNWKWLVSCQLKVWTLRIGHFFTNSLLNISTTFTCCTKELLKNKPKVFKYWLADFNRL